MHRNQYYDINDVDTDSICNEIAYPSLDGGFYSDAEHASPGLSVDPELFTPINILQQKTLQHMSFLEHQIYSCGSSKMNTSPGSVPTINKPVAYNSSAQSLNNSSMTPQRHSQLRERINNTGYVYIPPSDSLLHQKFKDDVSQSKDDNISPVTISSGYSSDKDDALRQLDLEYTSDDHYSPMLKRHNKMTSSEEIKSAVTPIYRSANNNKYNEQQLSRDIASLSSNNMSNYCTPPRHMQQHKTSKINSDPRRNSIAVSYSHQRTGGVALNNEVNKSLSHLVSNSSTTHRQRHTDVAPEVTSKHQSKYRAASTISNVTCSDIERLPEMLPAGVRTLYTTSSGLLMTPSSAAHCRRCMSFSDSAVVKSPTSDFSHFRVSANSAFKAVAGVNNSASSPNTRSRIPSKRDVISAYQQQQQQAGEDRFESYESRVTSNGSRVTSLSDSGRGSMTSLDLALTSVPTTPEREEQTFIDTFKCSSNNNNNINNNIPQRISYQCEDTTEQVYENVSDNEPQQSRRIHYTNTVINQQPPKLPKRNSRVTSRPPRSARKSSTSTLVKYEDIVKPQDIVDPSAMHMYTVADVLKSVDRLSSDIPQSNNDMCIHDDFAHFVFGSGGNGGSSQATPNQTQQSRVQDLNRDLYYTNERLPRHTASHMVETSKDLSEPLYPKQNTACKAHTKRLEKTDDIITCHHSNSPCLKNKHNKTLINTTALKSPARRTVSCVDRRRTRSKSLVRSLAVNEISWSPRSSMAEVYC